MLYTQQILLSGWGIMKLADQPYKEKQYSGKWSCVFLLEKVVL